MEYEQHKNSLFSEHLVSHIERLTKGKKGICATCGILSDSNSEFKMWDDSGEQSYESHYYEIGSITKTVTGYLMSEAVFSGKATVKDKINKWIPELNGEKYWPTIERLLTHTSGFPKDDESAYDEHEVEEANILNYTRNELIQKINELTLEDKIYQSAYSNIGCATIALVLEHIYGKSYKELVYEFLNQYHLENMKVYYTENIGLCGIGKDGRMCDNWKWEESNAFAPAGSIASTPEDLMKYGSIIFNQSEPVIQIATTPMQQYSNEGEEPKIMIGYFWFFLPAYNIYYHNGGTGCFNSALAIDIETKTIMSFLSNCYLDEDASFIISELIRLRT